MKAIHNRPLAAALTLAVTVGLAGFGLAHSHAPVAAAKPITLPDLPDGNGTGTRLPNGWHITPAGTHIALPGDLPLKMLFSPDGKYLLVSTGGYHNHSVSVIDPKTNTVVSSIDVDKDWAGLCFDPSGQTVYVAAGEGLGAEYLPDVIKGGATPRRIASMQETVLRLGYANGKLTLLPALPVPFLNGKEHWTAGLAAGSDGSLYAADVEGDAVYKLSGSPAIVQAQAKVGYHPYAVVLSPDGSTLAVSNWGVKSVSFLNASDLKETSRVEVGSHPNELVWAKDGRLFVANAGSNSVSIIKNSVVAETVKTSLSPTDLVGSTPDALAVSPDGKRLYVANADNNDVAVVDVSDAKASRVLGFIPTGWYPSAVAVAPDGRTLYVGTGKGLGFRGNAAATQSHTNTLPVKGLKYDYIGGLLSGTISAIRLPDAAGLARYTQQVLANVPHSAPASPALTASLSTLHKIKHVLYIVRENRTYDQVFGDIAKGNGDPNLTIFGQKVTPNAHALAARSVLLDNLYCNGEVSEDGHQWCDAAYATDFTEKLWPSAYSDRGEPDADERLTASPAGYLWDNCAKHHLTFYSYGEFASFKASPNTPPIFTGVGGLSGHASAAWSALSFDRHDTEHAAMFLADLHVAEKTGVWPRFIVMSLAEDHTQVLDAGKYTPVAHVAANDQALGQIVEGVSKSRFWKDTAIFVIEDDAQNGPDHVDAHRTVGLVISPYVKRSVVDSTQYTTASMVRTMEMILGLPPMTQYDRAATPMLSCFTPAADMTAYTDIGPKVDLEARNPAQGPGAVASARLDLSAPDRADPDALNAILWHALKPGVRMPAPVRSARLIRWHRREDAERGHITEKYRDLGARQRSMKIITLEEHFTTKLYSEATASLTAGQTPSPHLQEIGRKQADLGEGRLADMDAAGIDLQVLSLSGILLDKLDPATAAAVARDANDVAAAAVRAHPARFAALAAVALQEPEKAADELKRCVQELGFQGGIVNGTSGGLFLDDSRFAPIFEAAQALDVPLYLHPAPPPQTVREAYYSGLPDGYGAALSIAGWGWHVETGLHVLRLIVSGVFERYPRLQIVIGHMGEDLPFSLARAEAILGQPAQPVTKPLGETFRTNFHVTTSGYFTLPHFVCALMVVSADRLLFSVDYPFSTNAQGREFLDALPVSLADKEKIAHGNAERLLKLSV